MFPYIPNDSPGPPTWNSREVLSPFWACGVIQMESDCTSTWLALVVEIFYQQQQKDILFCWGSEQLVCFIFRNDGAGEIQK